MRLRHASARRRHPRDPRPPLTGRGVNVAPLNVSRLFENRYTDPARDSCVVSDALGLAAFAAVETLENREYVQATLGLRAETAGVTTPVLLGWVQRRAHEVALELGWATAVVVTWQLSGAPAEPVLRTRGWANVRRFNRLRGQLYRNVIVPPAPPGVVVHTAITDRQARQAHDVLEIALANHWEHRPKPTDRFLAIERAAEGHDQFLWSSPPSMVSRPPPSSPVDGPTREGSAGLGLGHRAEASAVSC